MLRSRIARVGLAVSITVLAAGILSSQAGAVSATPPYIVAKPNNLVVNTKTTLTGTGFPAKTRLAIQECSTNFWIAPKHPCGTANKITVQTDSHGKFLRQFWVALCGGKRGPVITSEICYIGGPKVQGKDTDALVGAVKVTVTYP